MAKGGCKAFADLIAASPEEASSTYKAAAEGGVTVFCPSDDAVKAFMPRYRNLSADGKASLLLFHAVPVHYSLGSLKSQPCTRDGLPGFASESNNGPMNTLVTDGAVRNYNFTLQNKDPVAIYVIDAVVDPVQL